MPRPQGGNGLSARRMVVVWTFRASHCVATCAVHSCATRCSISPLLYPQLLVTKAMTSRDTVGLTTEQLNDQVAAFGWLKAREYVNSNRIAAAGNSFGGIQSILGAAKLPYCAAVAASAASETWRDSPEIQQALKSAVRQSNVPMFLFQAQNDFDLSPNKTLVEEMQSVGKSAELKVYPAFGTSAKEGHSFAYLGSETWFPNVLAFLAWIFHKL